MIQYPSSQQWETLKVLDRTSPTIKVVARLLEQGHRIVFAPDYSEINSYIAPYRDLATDNIERNIRYWYSIKMLMDLSDFPVILLPPYWEELVNYVDILHKQQINQNDILDSKRTLFEDEKFVNYFENVSTSMDIADLDDVVAAISRYGKELGILHELMYHHEKIRLIKEIWNKEKLKRSHDVLKYLDEEEILRNSIKWQQKIYEARSARRPSSQENKLIARASHFDGWAIEYVKEANALAEQNPGKYPFLIYVTRTSDIHKIVGASLSIRISQVGRLNPLWNPDTNYAYQLFNKLVDQNYSEMIRTVEALYEIIKAYNKGNMPDEMLEKAVQFLESIENLNLYYGNIEDYQSHRLIDIKNLSVNDNLQQFQLVNEIMEFVKQNNVDKVLERVDIEINSLWKKFASSLPTVSIKMIDGKSFVTIKIPGHRVWLSIHSSKIVKIFSNVESVFEAIEVLNKQKTLLFGEDDICELLLVEALLNFGTEKWTRVDEILKQLEDTDNLHIQMEVCLLRLSKKFLLGNGTKNIKENISDCDFTFLHLDPRVPRVLSLLEWGKYQTSHKEEILQKAVKYARQAIELAAVDKSSEYYGECLNNLAYFELLLFQNNPSTSNLLVLSKLYSELRAFYSEQVESPFYPVEIIHTLGILQSNLAWYSDNISITNKIAMMEMAIKDLLLATRLNNKNDLFIHDYWDAERKLQELKMQVD